MIKVTVFITYFDCLTYGHKLTFYVFFASSYLKVFMIKKNEFLSDKIFLMYLKIISNEILAFEVVLKL